jgi:hypothetical protein
MRYELFPNSDRGLIRDARTDEMRSRRYLPEWVDSHPKLGPPQVLHLAKVHPICRNNGVFVYLGIRTGPNLSRQRAWKVIENELVSFSPVQPYLNAR